MAEGRRPGVLEMGWGAPSGRAAEGSVVGAQRRATVPAFLLPRRLDHPERYGGAAALHRSAPGAAVHLPFPLQVRAVPGAGGGGPAPGLGTLPRGRQGTPGPGFAFDTPFPAPSNVKQKLWPPVPDLHRTLGSFLHESSKHGQVRGPGQGPPRLSPPGGSSKGGPHRALSVCPPGQHLLQAAAGGGRPALPAGGAARPAGGAGRAAASAGARRRPPARHRHRQPVLPAHERLGAARAALSRAPRPGINETSKHPVSSLLRGAPNPNPAPAPNPDPWARGEAGRRGPRVPVPVTHPPARRRGGESPAPPRGPANRGAADVGRRGSARQLRLKQPMGGAAARGLNAAAA